MTAPTPDWFGPDDPEMQREFLNEIKAVHKEIARRITPRRPDVPTTAAIDRLLAGRPIRPSFTTGTDTPRLAGRIDLEAYAQSLRNGSGIELPSGRYRRRPGLEP